MKTKSGVLALILVVAAPLFLLTQVRAANDRWLHVRVEEAGEDGENVRVNLPLSLAEKVLPTLKSHGLENGKLKLEGGDIHGVDLRVLLEAVRALDDNEFVTVESKRETVRVAKSGGYLLAKTTERHDRDGQEELESVDVQIPLVVVDAMLSGAPDEIDIAAGIRALAGLGDTVLVTVKERNSSIRVWVDSKHTGE